MGVSRCDGDDGRGARGRRDDGDDDDGEDQRQQLAVACWRWTGSGEDGRERQRHATSALLAGHDGDGGD